MSKKAAAGKTKQKPARAGKRLGVKIYGGQPVKVGQIIVRQVGSKYASGKGTKYGSDYTIFAMRNGIVKFTKKTGKPTVCVL
jgi:large subunit ribosomal protein L27